MRNLLAIVVIALSLSIDQFSHAEIYKTVDKDGNIVLGDEFTPDGCRLWDKETRKKMDKDRFRQGLGSVVETYIEVAERLGLSL